MPLVNVHLIEGVFTLEQNSEMIHQLTETMVRIEGENLRPGTWMIVDEVKSGDWGIGGKAFTTADVHALQGKVPARRPRLESPDRDTQVRLPGSPRIEDDGQPRPLPRDLSYRVPRCRRRAASWPRGGSAAA